MIQLKEPYRTVNLSGRGGDYEKACQTMLRAGLDRLCQLESEVIAAVGNGGPTADQVAAVMGHLASIHYHGYNEWLNKYTSRTYLYPDNLPESILGQEAKS